jgi:hypothetical protein
VCQIDRSRIECSLARHLVPALLQLQIRSLELGDADSERASATEHTGGDRAAWPID